MVDIIFDIDGTLANAAHRLHFIKDPKFWIDEGMGGERPDWGSFLSDEQVAGDTPIPETWHILPPMLALGNRVMFITGRPERQRYTTWKWLMNATCDVRRTAAVHMIAKPEHYMLMRADGDRRPSYVVKRELLHEAQSRYNFDPKMVFEDRKDDTAMWRDEGLLCLQVAEGSY